MADISSFKALDGTTYDLKDATARGLLNGHSVNKDVPANAVFTDTTYGAATSAAAGLMSAADKAKLDAEILSFNLGTISSLPQTVSNSLITSKHVLLRAELGTPSAQKSDWTVDTSNGSVEIRGTISGQTTVSIVLGIPANA